MSLRAPLQALAFAMALLLAVGALGPARAEDRSPSWNSLTPAQKQVLAPLQRDWSSIEPARRLKWLEVAARYPQMPADERERLQARMSDWARMTPAQRATARQQFQEVRRVPNEERQARWQAYQSLPPEERDRLAQDAKPAARAKAAEAQARAASSADANGGNSKRNIVRAPSQTPPRVLAPGVQQARPGATTTTVTTRAAPPLHNQTGLPKIAATPNFVDPQTLLPQKGPQGAAVRSAAPASAPKKP
jgi:Protein of unknown function (DUF3106)